MPFNTSQLIFLGLVFLVGIILGSAIAWWLASRRKETPPDPEAELLKRLRSQYQELAGLWRLRSSGQLILRIDGQMLENAHQLSQTQRGRVQALIKDWLAWMGYPGVKPAAPTLESAHAPQVLVTPPPQPEKVPVSGAQRSEVPLSPVAAMGSTPKPVTSISDQVPATKPAEKPKSIVQQIDEILQEKLALSPARSKGVRLEEDPRDGVIVWIGLDRYRGVDNVADPEIKALLKAAAAEWERRTGRG